MKSYKLSGEELSSPGMDTLRGYSISNCHPLTHAHKDSVGNVCVCVCVIVLYICICIKNNYRKCHEFKREKENLEIVRSRGGKNDVNRVLATYKYLKK